MFERRLKHLVFLLALPAVAVCLRLTQLQLARADGYQADAERMLLRPARFFPCLRGSITDRHGTLLAWDAEAWDICVHYGAMTASREYFNVLARRNLKDRNEARSKENVRQESERLLGQLKESWDAIASLTGQSLEDLEARRRRIVSRVTTIKERVSERRRIATVIQEERMVHPMVAGIDRTTQVAARLALADYPWVEVNPSHERRYAGGEPVGHLLGLTREVDAETIEDDLHFDDALARYQPGDRFGFCGFEAMGESWLRGLRGRVHEDIDGNPLSPPVLPTDGNDLRLTLDLGVQQLAYDRVAAAVRQYPLSPGGAAVVIDIPTRQVLALVSYPSFDPNLPYERRLLLAQDWVGRPTHARAIGQGQAYPPGSTIKPLVLAAALTEHKTHPRERITCRGHLFADHPDKWRCSAIYGHGPVDPLFSIQHSCNVFYYVLGERLGVSRLSAWYRQSGMGQTIGTGLPEENPGWVPEQGSRGDARNMAIGQGRFEATPLQAANLAATLATGSFRPVTMWLDDPRERQAARLPVAESHWQIVRKGMYQAVNVHGGTAYGKAQLSGVGDLVLLGKTGSAEAPPLESLYRCEFPDGHVEEVRATSGAEIRSRYDEGERPRILAQHPAADYPTHGWFIGYTTRDGHETAPVRAGQANAVAIAVVIEYAGHGGEVAGPVARDILMGMLQGDGEKTRALARMEE